MFRKLSLVLLPAIAAVAVACGGSGDAAPADATEIPTASATVASTATPAPPKTTATSAPIPLSSRRETPERQILLAAVQNTAEGQSYRYAYTVEISGLADLPVTVPSVTLAVTGASDPSTGASEMTLDFSDLVSALAEGSTDPEAAALVQAIFGSEPLELRYLDGVAYLRGPLIHAFLDVPTNWVSFPATLDESTQSLGNLGFGEVNSQDEIFAFLDQVYDVVSAGTETVRGVETTHYSGVISLATLIKLSNPDDAAKIEDRLGIKLEDHLGDAPLDVWIDADGLIRRVDLVTDFSDFGGVGRYTEEAVGSMSLTYEVYDVGEPFLIEYPPAYDVTPVQDTFLNAFGDPQS